MNILVTGGAGFIASHIVDRYIECGHHVSIIDNLLTGKKENINPKATFYNIDIRDKERVEAIFKSEKFDVLNHHAAQLDVRKSVADPLFDAEINLIGLLNLLEAGLKQGIQKVIFASSGGVVYGEASVVPTPEDYQPLHPLSPYGITKLTSELYLSFYQRIHAIPFVALRYANVYGPRQDPFGEAGVVAIFIEKLLSNQQPVINGDGRQLRDYTYIGDVVDANQKALEIKKSGIFNIGTGQGTSVNEIFSHLQSIIGSTFEEKHGPAKKGEQKQSILDNSRAQKILQWKPRVALKEGLAQTVAYFKNVKK